MQHTFDNGVFILSPLPCLSHACRQHALSSVDWQALTTLLRLPPLAPPSAVAVECAAGLARVLPAAVPLECLPLLILRLGRDDTADKGASAGKITLAELEQGEELPKLLGFSVLYCTFLT